MKYECVHASIGGGGRHIYSATELSVIVGKKFAALISRVSTPVGSQIAEPAQNLDKTNPNHAESSEALSYSNAMYRAAP